jgi:hypothetical protein
VTLINCSVTSSAYSVVHIGDGVTGVTVQNCTINGVGSGNDGSHGIQGQGTFIANNIYNVENGITLSSGNSLIQDNFIHDLRASGSPHYDGIQIDGGISNVIIRHNTVINDHNQTAAVMIDNYFGPISNITVDNNVLVGGGYTVYSDGQFSGGSITGVSITNNHIGGGYWGDITYTANTPVYTGNVRDGETIAAGLPTTGQPPAPTAPSAPTITSISNDSGTAGDGLTNDSTLTLTGNAAANSTVNLFDGTTQIGTATANSSGTWTHTTTALSNGSHSLTATATTSSGTSSASSALAVRIDTTAPTAPTIATPTNNANGGLNLTGTAEANSVVSVFDGTTQIGTATANGSGVWGYTTGTLATGTHSLTARATDAAGNTGAVSGAVTASTGTSQAPAAPRISSFSNDSGAAGDRITNDSTLTLTGTAAAYGTVNVFDGPTQIGTATANSSGAWTYTTTALADGNHNVTARVTTAAGTSAASPTLAVTIDTTAPTAPRIGSYTTDGVALASASSTTDVNHLTLNGTAEANSTVRVFDGTAQIGTATANANGAWSYTASNLADGNHSFTSRAVDAAGNTSAASAALGVNVDTHDPTPEPTAEFTGVNPRWNDSVVLRGTADPGSHISIYDNGGTTPVATAEAGQYGNWRVTTSSSISDDVVHRFTATVTDASGQTAPSSGSIVLGTTGDERLTSTSGNDLFRGQGGHDTFVFAANFGRDVITDFRATGRSHDVVEFSRTVFDSFAEVLAHASQSGQDVVIDAGEGNTLTLRNTSLTSLDRTDFQFA